MGGRALKPLGIEVRRYTTEELEPIQEEIHALLREVGVTDVWSPQAVRSKKDHGDLDIFYVADQSVVDLIDLGETVRNGNMIHTAWGDKQDLQVDFIKMQPEEWETAKMYYDNGDLGNIIGKMCYNLGLSYTHHGLYYVYTGGSAKHKIHLSSDPKTICNILHLDKAQMDVGFDTDEDLFKFIYDNPLTNPEYFKLSHLTGRDKIRNRKRPHYQKFVEFVATQPPKEGCPPRKPHYTEMVKYIEFGINIGYMIKEGIELYEAEKARKQEKAKNRKKVVAKLMGEGYSGKELGRKVQEYLKS